jgi:hypothetical protein
MACEGDLPCPAHLTTKGIAKIGDPLLMAEKSPKLRFIQRKRLTIFIFDTFCGD